MRRRDLIPILLDHPRTPGQVARELGQTLRETAAALEHLERSLRHLPYELDWTPARCRRCDFRFEKARFTRPSRCPQCHGTWIAEARVAVHEKPADGAAREPVDTGLSSPAGPEPGGTAEGIEWLDHTADAGMVVRASDLPGLFARCAWGMFAVITEPASVRPREAVEVRVEAADLPGLLVAWLSELNYRHIIGRLVFGEFDGLQIEQGRLQGVAHGEKIDPDRHPIHTEIKAVTFHGLEVGPEGDGWRAQVIFDL